MAKKIKPVIIVILIVLAAGGFIFYKSRSKIDMSKDMQEIKPHIGSIKNIISTTGTVLPKNRLEIKPPVNGRIDSILVKEGQKVKLGQILAWMSSTERAALLDAAQSQGPEKLKYWQEAYKPIALLASIDGEVIVSTTQPGQTVTTNDAVIVLSDHLIARAQVDETDIGKVKLGQDAVISIDAYPDIKIKAKVEHIYYESKTVNNVTIYDVDLIPENIPEFFRSGMNANIEFITSDNNNALLIPQEAVQKEKDENFVLVKEGNGFVKRPVKLGPSNENDTEVISGLKPDETIVIKSKKFVLPKSDIGSNPFMPFRGKKQPAKK